MKTRLILFFSVFFVVVFAIVFAVGDNRSKINSSRVIPTESVTLVPETATSTAQIVSGASPDIATSTAQIVSGASPDTATSMSQTPQIVSGASPNSVASCTIDTACTGCNVILLSVDSLRADHIGAYGYERETTPYFDELAKKGALFENYFSPSFLTPVSEMSVHTGMYPTAHKTTNFDTVLPENITTLAQYFKQ